MFLFDIGILNCILNIPSDAVLGEQLGTYKGFMLENIVAQELFFQTNRELVSWTEGTAELEFFISNGADIIPLEVKSAARNRRSKSLDAYIDRYSPSHAVKLSRQNLGENQYRIGCLKIIILSWVLKLGIPIQLLLYQSAGW